MEAKNMTIDELIRAALREAAKLWLVPQDCDGLHKQKEQKTRRQEGKTAWPI